jgi:hypothetical protein
LFGRHKDPCILYCFVEDFPKARESVKAFAPGAIFLDTSASPTAYPDLVEDYWTGKRDLVIIEQDIVIRDGTIHSLLDCDQDWCTYAYKCPGPEGSLYDNSLGCTKISKKMQKVYPFARLREVIPNLYWHTFDLAIQAVVWHDLDAHLHSGEIEHLHEFPKAKGHPGDGLIRVEGDFYVLYDRDTGKELTRYPVMKEVFREPKGSKIQ